jgi:hypothetical protein
MFAGQILDGRNRHKAALAVGLHLPAPRLRYLPRLRR